MIYKFIRSNFFFSLAWTCNDPLLWVSPVLFPHFWDIILLFPFHQCISWKGTMVDEFVWKAGKHYTWMICDQNLFAHARLSVQLQVPRYLPHWDVVLSSSQTEVSGSLPSVPPIHSTRWRKPPRYHDAESCSFLFVNLIAFFFKCNCLSKTLSCSSLRLSPYHIL